MPLNDRRSPLLCVTACTACCSFCTPLCIDRTGNHTSGTSTWSHVPRPAFRIALFSISPSGRSCRVTGTCPIRYGLHPADGSRLRLGRRISYLDRHDQSEDHPKTRSARIYCRGSRACTVCVRRTSGLAPYAFARCTSRAPRASNHSSRAADCATYRFHPPELNQRLPLFRRALYRLSQGGIGGAEGGVSRLASPLEPRR